MPAPDATVFVVDDDQAVRQSMEMLVKSMRLNVKTFGSGQEFLSSYDPAVPGCLILDVRMPGMSGLELQRALRERHIDIPTIVVTGHGDVPVAVRALKDGAFEFLEKPFSKQLLLEHIQDALRRDASLRERRGQLQHISGRLSLLSQREKEVLDAVVAGKASKEIAAQLFLSKKTVDVHRANIMRKLQVESIAELVEMVVTARITSASDNNS